MEYIFIVSKRLKEIPSVAIPVLCYDSYNKASEFIDSQKNPDLYYITQIPHFSSFEEK